MNSKKGILVILSCFAFQPAIFAQQTITSQDINQQLLEAAGKGDKAAVESLAGGNPLVEVLAALKLSSSCVT